MDLGVGDVVTANAMTISLLKYQSKPFFEDKISIKAYPPEFIFAEKLIAIISKGAINSRMKDFYDLIIMSRNTNLIQVNQLQKAIDQVFEHKGIKKTTSIKFSKTDYKRFEKLWEQYRQKRQFIEKKKLSLKKFEHIISELNVFLKTIY